MDAIAVNVAVLAAALPDVDVCTEVPPDRPGRMVVVERTGGAMDTCFDYPEITLTCWGATDQEASALAVAAARALFEAAQTHPLLSSSDMESKSGDDWPQDGTPRHRVVLQQVINA